jgi:hypothetical protein
VRKIEGEKKTNVATRNEKTSGADARRGAATTTGIHESVLASRRADLLVGRGPDRGLGRMKMGQGMTAKMIDRMTSVGGE